MEIGRGRDVMAALKAPETLEKVFQSPMEIGRGRDPTPPNCSPPFWRVSVSDGDWKRSRPVQHRRVLRGNVSVSDGDWKRSRHRGRPVFLGQPRGFQSPMEIGRGRDYHVCGVCITLLESVFESPMEIGRGRDAVGRGEPPAHGGDGVSVSDGDWKRSRRSGGACWISIAPSGCFSLRWRLEEVAIFSSFTSRRNTARQNSFSLRWRLEEVATSWKVIRR